MPPDSSSRSQSSNGKFCRRAKRSKSKPTCAGYSTISRCSSRFPAVLKNLGKGKLLWNKLETFVWVAL